MHDFGKYHTSSTSIEPNSLFQGNDVKKLSAEMEFKLKMAHQKRLAIKHFMTTTTSSASKNHVPKMEKMTERNKIQTLDVERQRCLPRSFSFDSKDSRMGVDPHDDMQTPLKPYDPIKNYLSPRSRYLKFNPDRHREISARQKNVTRVRRSASYDDTGMRFPKEKLESSFSSREESVEEETGIIAPEHEHEEEEEKEGVFDDFEEGSGWNSKVFVQYLIVIIVLILTTVAIICMNSPNLSPAREAIRGFMNLDYCSVFRRTVGFDFSEVGKLSKREVDVDVNVKHDDIWKKDVGDDDNMHSNQLEAYKTEEMEEIKQNCMIDEYHDENIWSKNDTGQFQDSIEKKEDISYEVTSEEIYSGFDRGETSVESEVLEMMVEEDVGKEDAFIGVCVLILLATLSIIYYSKKSEISSFVKYKTTHVGSLIDSDAVSSSEAKSSYMEFSTDSPSYGSFTVEKKIVKKKKSKKPEVMLSPVRRSSRIHNRSITKHPISPSSSIFNNPFTSHQSATPPPPSAALAPTTQASPKMVQRRRLPRPLRRLRRDEDLRRGDGSGFEA
ncbi:unnamed protein product [Lactuca virosa]|uniref:Uncharacterized protein n=1 Tax=Lactuca virosa TaxID=75947 RepID=A0AAU9MIA5_9ASTR|nr:unnamed protein product [Lactuca virosa]